MNKCLNCGSEVSGKYCPDCGQAISTSRFGGKHLIKDFLHGFFHWESSFFITSGRLITGPGVFVKEYLQGKRKSFVNPFSYFLFLLAIDVIVFHLLSEKYFAYMNVGMLAGDKLSVAEKIQHVVSSNINYLNFLFSAVFAFTVKLFFGKRTGINISEALVFSMYSFATIFIFGIALMLLSMVDIRFWNLRLIVSAVYLTYAVVSFADLKGFYGILKALSSVFVSYLIFILIISGLSFLYLIFILRINLLS